MTPISSKSLKIPDWAFTEESIKHWKKCCYQTLYQTYRLYKDTNIKRCNVFCNGCSNGFRIIQYSLKYEGLTFTTENNKNYYAFTVSKSDADINFLFPASFGIWAPNKEQFLDNLVSAKMLSYCGKKLMLGGYKDINEYINEVAKLPEGKNSWVDVDLKMTKSIMIVLEGINNIELCNKLIVQLNKERIKQIHALNQEGSTE